MQPGFAESLLGVGRRVALAVPVLKLGNNFRDG